MAGFDFQVPVEPKERDFAAALLRYLQRLSFQRLCDRPTVVRFAWQRPSRDSNFHHYLVNVDGDFAEIQAFSVDALIAMLHFSSGYIAANSKYRNSMLPMVAPIAFFKRTHEFALDLHDFQSKVYEIGAFVTPNTYTFRQTGTQTVDHVLSDTSGMLLLWRSGHASPPMLVEQLHTAAEVALKRAIGAPNRDVTFANLVSTAEERQIISTKQATALHRLKNQRRDAKHRAQGVGARGLNETVQLVVSALHNIAVVLDTSASTSFSPDRRANGIPPLSPG